MNDPLPNIPPSPQRRVLISESGPGGLPIQLGTISPLPEVEPPKPAQEIENRQMEAQWIVKRLLVIIEEHRVSALRIGRVLDASALEVVISALEAELRNEDPLAILLGEDEIRSYVLTSLYEDLLAEPSNVLHTTRVAEDVIRYEAMEAAFWKECVAALRKKLNL